MRQPEGEPLGLGIDILVAATLPDGTVGMETYDCMPVPVQACTLQRGTSAAKSPISPQQQAYTGHFHDAASIKPCGNAAKL